MSHAATNWAIKQKGLEPVTKLLLWHLADCHNPTAGCFPEQGYLASELEVSRSTVNRHLDKLEERGLIRRERRFDPTTRQQKSTRYFLAFEQDFPTQDVVGRVSDCDTGGRVSNSPDPVSHSSDTQTCKGTGKTPLPPSHRPTVFNKIWDLWPDNRRGNRDQAEKAMDRCDDEVVPKLTAAAELYLSFQNRQPAAEKKRTALLSEFIRSGLYEDFIDPPEISFDGHFKITQAMPEWDVWMRSLAALHKREIAAVETHFKNAGGVLLVRTRWPDGYKQRSTS